MGSGVSRRNVTTNSVVASDVVVGVTTKDMNNPKSTALGWGTLVVAAGVSYIFAKKGIDERREKQKSEGSRPTEKLDWRQKIEREESLAKAQQQDAVNSSPKVNSDSSGKDEVPRKDS